MPSQTVGIIAENPVNSPLPEPGHLPGLIDSIDQHAKALAVAAFDQLRAYIIPAQVYRPGAETVGDADKIIRQFAPEQRSKTDARLGLFQFGKLVVIERADQEFFAMGLPCFERTGAGHPPPDAPCRVP